jgi:hypothetical protein
MKGVLHSVILYQLFVHSQKMAKNESASKEAPKNLFCDEVIEILKADRFFMGNIPGQITRITTSSQLSKYVKDKRAYFSNKATNDPENCATDFLYVLLECVQASGSPLTIDDLMDAFAGLTGMPTAVHKLRRILYNRGFTVKI